MPGNPGGIQCGALSLLHTPNVLGSVVDGCKSRRLLQEGISGFKGSDTRGPLSPTIFNVVLDVVVWHWVGDMVESAGRKGRRGQEGRY